MILVSFACKSEPKKPSEEDIKKEITTAFNNLYKDYSNADVEKFSEYYLDDVVRMGSDGTTQVGKAKFVEGWKESYKKYKVVILDYSEPTIFPGEDQSMTYNTYHELFIDRETQDTTEVRGTWVALWQKQKDNTWKLRMTTWHQN